MIYSKDHANAYIASAKDNVISTHRHGFHFMPLVGWMNDPNGFTYFQGYFHLFYQFYPYDASWGPMHWGHARSKNLLDWEHLPVALAPDLVHEEGCFSGGATLFKNDLVLMYTSHHTSPTQRQEQSVAFSSDGITFTKHTRPVITIEHLPPHASKTDFRDPNPVIIDGKTFILVGSSTNDKKGQILVYSTQDFKTFTYVNAIQHPMFGEIAECPDLFEQNGKHVLLFSSTQLKQDGHRFKNVNSSLYAIGAFDSHTGVFTFDHVDELDAGHHYYAPQTVTYHDQQISVAWMEMWGKPYYTSQAKHGWAGALTLPRQLTVKENRLYQTPLTLNLLKGKTISLTPSTPQVTSKRVIITGRFHPQVPLVLQAGSDTSYVTLSINDHFITLDTSNVTLFPMEARFVPHTLSMIDFTLVIDQSSLELFVKDLDKTITTRFYMDEPSLSLTLKTTATLTLQVKIIQ